VRILLCNNRVQGGSGTDAMVDLEASCLEASGHEVSRFERRNEELSTGPLTARLSTWLQLYWPARAAQRLQRHAAAFRPDVVHVHNAFPLLTGFVYEVARHLPRCVTVQSLHNYRAFCPQSYAFRAGHSCELCRGRAFLPCAVYRCYRNSFSASAATVALRWAERLRGRPLGFEADLFVAVSRHVAGVHVRLGLPASDVHVLPNAAQDLAALAAGEPAAVGRPRRLVYVGAMLDAKGIWRLLPLAAALPEMEVHAIGAGPEAQSWTAAARAQGLRNVVAHGYQPPPATAALWRMASLTLVPSAWDEPFGLSAAESFSLGIPVLTTGAGGLADIVSHDRDGIVDSFADPGAMARNIRALFDDPARYARLCASARVRYNEEFSPAAYQARLQDFMEGPVARRLAERTAA
jgi:glycosyltransferase involved in cell wall biosynthesis